MSDQSGADTTLQCTTCGRELDVRFAFHLRSGWPLCPSNSEHGTMAIADVEPGVIEAAVDERLAPARAALDRAMEVMDRRRDA
jgi:hypothetical protein